jgi:biotin carboxylase
LWISPTTRPAPVRTSRPRRNSLPRLLLLLPTSTYRTAAFVEAARRLQVDLTVASEQSSSFEAALPGSLLTLDFAHPDRAAERVRAFARRHPIDAVQGVDDDTALLASVLAVALGLPANPVLALEAARDKYRQREILARYGVPVPRFSLYHLEDDLEAIAGAAPFPCVVKPLRLSASRGVIRANTPGEFVAAVRRLITILAQPDVAAACGETARGFLVEEYVPGAEVALEALLVAGRLRPLALFDKPDPLEGPFFEETVYVVPSSLPRNAQQAVMETAERAAHALGLTRGPIHAELRWNERGAWLIELAARPIGGRCSAVLRFSDGATLEELVIREALGLPLGALTREAQAASVMMIPVPGPGVLRDVQGVEEARNVPGIDDVVITAHRGQELVPWPEGNRYPGFIFARGASPEVAVAAVREAHRRIRLVRDPLTD